VAFLLTCCSAYVQGTVFASYYLVASGGRFCRITMWCRGAVVLSGPVFHGRLAWTAV